MLTLTTEHRVVSARLTERGNWFARTLLYAAEFEKRRVALALPPTPEWARRGYAHLFNESILQADEGCDFDFMRGQGKG